MAPPSIAPTVAPADIEPDTEPAPLLGDAPMSAVAAPSCAGTNERVEFYVVFGIYLAAIFGIALWCFWKFTVKAGDGSALMSHFYANNSFGFVLLFLTTFSTAISGYTAVGVPQEASGLGFISVGRWMLGLLWIGVAQAPVLPRYRRLSQARRWESPMDLFLDRFNFRPLGVLATLVGLVAVLIYIVAQLRSLSDTIEVVSNGHMGGRKTMFGLSAFILVCEWIGGMAAVSITDACQTIIMFVAFIGGAFCMLHRYGGLVGVTEPGCSYGSCIANVKPWMVLYPGNGVSDLGVRSGVPQLAALDAIPEYNYVAADMLSFGISFLGLALSPHWTMKAIMAKSDNDLKKASMLLAPVAWAVTFPSLCLGVVKAAAFPTDTSSAFGCILSDFLDTGGLVWFIGLVMSCSALAAIMSTADSALIAFSNLVLVDLGRNWLMPDLDHKSIVTISKGVSLLCMVVAAALAVSLEDDVDSYRKLIRYQFGLSMQLYPVVVGGLWLGGKRLCGPACCAGVAAGIIVLLALELGPVSAGREAYTTSAVWSFVANVAVTALAQGCAGADDAARAPPLGVAPAIRARTWGEWAPDTVEMAMMGTTEPLKNWLGRAAWGLLIVVCVVACPWYHRPWREFAGLSADASGAVWSGHDGRCGAPYCVDQVAYIAGIPQWVFILLMLAVVGTLLQIVLLSTWKCADPAQRQAQGAQERGDDGARNRGDEDAFKMLSTPLVEHDQFASRELPQRQLQPRPPHISDFIGESQLAELLKDC